jgi:type VI secretion system protein ImpE
VTLAAAIDARETLRVDGARAALAKLKEQVRKAPRDPRLRVFLFQLFCVFAEWDRALTQLTVAAELDPASVPMAQTYRAVIRCEVLRERVFAGLRAPTVFGEPAGWMSLLVEANRLLAAGATAQAAELRDAAFADAPATAGSIDDRGFAWIADADPRLGPLLEAMVEGRYFWVPFIRLSRVDIEPPADLRDHVWMPVRFTWSTGGETVGFIPTRYPGSAVADEALALARRTEFQTLGDWALGLGQRMWATDAEEVALMDVRSLRLGA